MYSKKINKEYRKFITPVYNLRSTKDIFESGIIYTLYSVKWNSLEIGFAENEKVLNIKLSNDKLVLLDKKKGKKKELTLLINILNEFGIKHYDNLNFKYSNTLIRHLSTLGWPIGRSLYKKRKIKKKYLCA